MAGVTRSSAAPHVRVTHSTTQSIAHNTQTALAFDTETYDVGGLHDNSTNNSRLTATVAGLYVISGSVNFALSAGGTRRMAAIRFNGTLNVGHNTSPVTASNWTPTTASAHYRLAVGDYVELMADQDTGGALSTNNTFPLVFAMALVSL